MLTLLIMTGDESSDWFFHNGFVSEYSDDSFVDNADILDFNGLCLLGFDSSESFHNFTDYFDAHHGTIDFNYSADDMDVFPTVSIDVLPIFTPSGESVIQSAKHDYLVLHR